jgi:hypothetical protein
LLFDFIPVLKSHNNFHRPLGIDLEAAINYKLTTMSMFGFCLLNKSRKHFAAFMLNLKWTMTREKEKT